MLFQAKGFPYLIEDLVPDQHLVQRLRYGYYVTLRLKSSMYHRFHAPADGRVREVIYQSGDTWNVNPIALKRIENLYCKNERAVVDLDTGVDGLHLVMVPVAAILVASVRIHGLEKPLNLRYAGPNHIDLCRAYDRGEEMGYFEHGSTIVLFTSPEYRFCDSVREGETIRMGEALMRKA